MNRAPTERTAASRSAAATASLVLPVPPGPVRVTSRASSSQNSASISASSRVRPISLVGGDGSTTSAREATVSCAALGDGAAASSGSCRRIAAFEGPQARARLDADLLHERVARAAIRLQRVRLASGAVEREDLMLAQALAEGVLGDQPRHLGDDLVVVASRQPCLDQQLERRQV